MQPSHYSHLYLYAKGHYQRSEDIVLDLRKIAAAFSGCSLELILIRDVLLLINGAIGECLRRCYDNNPQALLLAMSDAHRYIDTEQALQLRSSYPDNAAGFTIRVFMNLVMCAPISKDGVCILHLEKPNSSILPLSSRRIT